MKRRDFITLLGGAAAAWPIAARAQQLDRVVRIGILGPRPENTGISGGMAVGYPAMLDELRKLGFSEGRNLTAEFRLVEQERRAVFADAAELVRSNADVRLRSAADLARTRRRGDRVKRREFITLLGGAAARDGLRGDALYWTCSGWLSFQSRPGGGASGRE
jgi:hypothetical protein